MTLQPDPSAPTTTVLQCTFCNHTTHKANIRVCPVCKRTDFKLTRLTPKPRIAAR